LPQPHVDQRTRQRLDQRIHPEVQRLRQQLRAADLDDDDLQRQQGRRDTTPG